MKSIYEGTGKEHQVISTFHKLIVLELATWVPVIIILLHRMREIEQIMDKESDKLLNRMEHFIHKERDQDPSDRNQRFISLLSELPAWRFHAVNGRKCWNPMEEALHDFSNKHGPATVFESPNPKPEPAVIIDWLYQLHGHMQAQGQDALAS